MLKQEKLQLLASSFGFYKCRRLDSTTALYSKANIALPKMRRKEKNIEIYIYDYQLLIADRKNHSTVP